MQIVAVVSSITATLSALIFKFHAKKTHFFARKNFHFLPLFAWFWQTQTDLGRLRPKVASRTLCYNFFVFALFSGKPQRMLVWLHGGLPRQRSEQRRGAFNVHWISQKYVAELLESKLYRPLPDQCISDDVSNDTCLQTLLERSLREQNFERRSGSGRRGRRLWQHRRRRRCVPWGQIIMLIHFSLLITFDQTYSSKTLAFTQLCFTWNNFLFLL